MTCVRGVLQREGKSRKEADMLHVYAAVLMLKNDNELITTLNAREALTRRTDSSIPAAHGNGILHSSYGSSAYFWAMHHVSVCCITVTLTSRKIKPSRLHLQTLPRGWDKCPPASTYGITHVALPYQQYCTKTPCTFSAINAWSFCPIQRAQDILLHPLHHTAETSPQSLWQ